MTDEEHGKLDLEAVRITSERLTLVPITPAYRKDIFREFTSEITTHMFPSAPESIADTDEYIAKTTAERAAGTDLAMAILKDGEFLGNGGIHALDTRTPELGIWIKKSAHGNAYGREAVTAIKNWADENLNYDYLEYPVVAINVSSRKIAESLGGTVDREFNKKNGRGEDREMVMYHIPRGKRAGDIR